MISAPVISRAEAGDPLPPGSSYILPSEPSGILPFLESLAGHTDDLDRVIHNMDNINAIIANPDAMTLVLTHLFNGRHHDLLSDLRNAVRDKGVKEAKLFDERVKKALNVIADKEDFFKKGSNFIHSLRPFLKKHPAALEEIVRISGVKNNAALLGDIFQDYDDLSPDAKDAYRKALIGAQNRDSFDDISLLNLYEKLNPDQATKGTEVLDSLTASIKNAASKGDLQYLVEFVDNANTYHNRNDYFSKFPGILDSLVTAFEGAIDHNVTNDVNSYPVPLAHDFLTMNPSLLKKYLEAAEKSNNIELLKELSSNKALLGADGALRVIKVARKKLTTPGSTQEYIDVLKAYADTNFVGYGEGDIPPKNAEIISLLMQMDNVEIQEALAQSNFSNPERASILLKQHLLKTKEGKRALIVAARLGKNPFINRQLSDIYKALSDKERLALEKRHPERVVASNVPWKCASLMRGLAIKYRPRN